MSAKRKISASGISKLIQDEQSSADNTKSTCALCSEPADKLCGNCRLVNYCSVDHQKSDWKEHRKICCPFSVHYSDDLGRYLVASRDIEERSLIIHEAPFAFAPYDTPVSENEENVSMCLGCCYRMSDVPDRRCSLCRWPVCSTECEEMSPHTHNECPMFTEKKIAYPPPQRDGTYSSILILRLLLQKEKSPSLWQTFLQMEHHSKSRFQKERCNTDDALVLENLREYFKDDPTGMDETEIREIIGRVSVNSFGVTRREEGRNDDTIGRGVFLKTGIVAHACVPNAVWGISKFPSFEIIVKSAVPIKKGEVITPTYSDIWNSMGTYHRLVTMFERSHFICKCRRCLDPTELGTYLSAVRCPKCQDSFLLPLNPLDLSDNARWQCENKECGAGDCQLTIVNLVEDIQYEIDQVIAQEKEAGNRTDELEQLYEKYCGTILHENHFVIRTLEKAIIEKLFPLLTSSTFTELNSFIFHCENLLKVNDILTPGYCGHGGAIRNYLCQGLIEKKTKAVKSGKVQNVFKSSKAFNDHINKIDKLKKEAVLHWENDPDSTPMNWDSFVTRSASSSS